MPNATEDNFSVDDWTVSIEDWIKKMPTLERKMLGIFLYRHEHQTHQTDRTTAAETTGQALGYFRKTKHLSLIHI